jgi:hypothetical protein
MGDYNKRSAFWCHINRGDIRCWIGTRLRGVQNGLGEEQVSELDGSLEELHMSMASMDLDCTISAACCGTSAASNIDSDQNLIHGFFPINETLDYDGHVGLPPLAQIL